MKPYNDLNTYLQRRFGTKVYKVALQGGTTCPTRDGSLGTGGCIFCSAGGSGDFAAPAGLSVSDQISYSISRLAHKLGPAASSAKYIAYFQSYTSTYVTKAQLLASGYQPDQRCDYLRDLFLPAINDPRICALSIATRPDCLDEDVLDLLSDLNAIKPVWVELGLQTIHPASAAYIRRGYPLSVFDAALTELRARNLEVIVHVILGLPDETLDQMLETVRYVGQSGAQGIKLQLLHILKGTDLGREFEADPAFTSRLRLQTPDQYVDLLIRALKELPPDLVIHRLTGDPPHKDLLYPLWSANKRTTLNRLHHILSQTD